MVGWPAWVARLLRQPEVVLSEDPGEPAFRRRSRSAELSPGPERDLHQELIGAVQRLRTLILQRC
jgi:hypothetical protein